MYLLLLCPHPLFFHCQYLGIETIATFISECHFIRLLPYLPEHFIPIHQTWSDSFLVFFFFFIILVLPLMSVFLTRWIQPYKNSICPCLAFTFWGLKDEPSDVCAYNEALKEILKCKWSQHMWSDVLSFVTPCLLYEKLQIFLTLWCFYISYYDTTKILSEPSVILVIPRSVSVTSTDFSRLFL